MDGHSDIPPSYTGLNQYPTTPYGDGGDQSFNQATMPPPSGSSPAPFPQCHQFPPTGQPSQYGSQNFIPGPSPSRSMFSLPSSSLFSFPPLSPSSFRPPSATVANKDTAVPQIPYMMPPSKARSSDNDIRSRLNSLLAARNNQRTYPRPIEMPVGVRSQNEDANVFVNSNGNKRRACNEIAPPGRIWRTVPADGYLNGNSSVVAVEPSPLPPQGVSVGVGNGNAYGCKFTPSQLSKIAASDELKKKAASDPKGLKRLLSNREAAARSRGRKELHLAKLEVKVEILETRVDTLTAELKLANSEKTEANDECVRLRIRIDGGEEQGRLREALVEQLNGEVQRRTQEATREREEARRQSEEASRQREEVSRLRAEVNEYRRRESERMNANMLEQLNINQQFQEMPPQTNYNFE